MRAIMHTAFGSPQRVLTVGEMPRPEPRAGELLVEVAAVGLAKGDWLTTEGIPYIARPAYGMTAPRRQIAGQGFAGRVISAGRRNGSATVAGEVFGVADGALADVISVSADRVVAIPGGISAEEAASAPISGLAALQALSVGARTQAGERVLVIGASGSVGSYAVQIGKAWGAHVTAVASGRRRAMLEALGADAVLDYATESITARGIAYDRVLDLAGNRRLATLRRVLTREGRLVIVGGTGGRWTMGFGRTVRAMLLSKFVTQELIGLISEFSADDLRTLADLLASGAVRPVIGERYPFEAAADAMAAVGTGRAPGAVVVTA